MSEVDIINNQANSQILSLKVVPLKVTIFGWRLFMNHITTKDNLVRWQVLITNDHRCVANFGVAENKDHLFVTCNFLVNYGLLFLIG